MRIEIIFLLRQEYLNKQLNSYLLNVFFFLIFFILTPLEAPENQSFSGEMEKKQKRLPRRCYIKNVFLKFLQKFTGKHMCQSLFLNKVAGLRPAILFKKRLWHRYIPVNFAKFFRTSFLQNTSGRLLLKKY